MLRPTLLALSIGLVSACSGGAGNTPSPTTTDTAATVPETTGAAAKATAPTSASHDSHLVASHWQLVNASNADGKRYDGLFARPEKPVQLDFSNGRLVITGGCNTLTGPYTLTDTSLTFGQMASTLMACPPPLFTVEEAITRTLTGEMRIEALTPDVLKLVASNGDTFEYKGVPTAATRYGGPGETVFWEVAPQARPCPHALKADAQCLQVREIHFDDKGLKVGTPGEFTHFYGEIEGYSHQPGIRNVLRLKRYAIANPPADAPDKAYVLDLVVESGQ